MMIFTNFQAKQIGDTHFDRTTSTNLAPLSGTQTDTSYATYNNLIIVRLNLIEDTINGYSN